MYRLTQKWSCLVMVTIVIIIQDKASNNRRRVVLLKMGCYSVTILIALYTGLLNYYIFFHTENVADFARTAYVASHRKPGYEADDFIMNKYYPVLGHFLPN